MARTSNKNVKFKKNVVYIYTDGSCNNHPNSNKKGLGGLSVALFFNEHTKFVVESHSNTTSSKMELMAAYKGLSLLKGTKYPVKLISDSQYVVNGINQWMIDWAKYDFNTVKNALIWRDIYMLRRKLNFEKIDVSWVKGHNGDFGNETADHLANFAYKTIGKYYNLKKFI